MDYKSILNFITEIGNLKRVKRSGWWVLDIPHEESVADHSFRCLVIGYLLARLEEADISKVLLMTLFNDVHESRITDLHKMAHKYIDVRKAEKSAFKDQMKNLDKKLQREMTAFRKEYDSQESRESQVARDADILECLIQAKEYYDQGFKNADKFFKKAPKFLKTKSAKNLWKESKKWDSSKWWENLSKFER